MIAQSRVQRLKPAVLGLGRAIIFCSLATVITAAEAETSGNPQSSIASTGTLTRLQFEISGQASTNPVLRLRGADARQQIIVTAGFDTGAVRDYTRRVYYQATPAGIVQVSGAGLITPMADGTATITAKSSEGAIAKLEVTVKDSK